MSAPAASPVPKRPEIRFALAVGLFSALVAGAALLSGALASCQAASAQARPAGPGSAPAPIRERPYYPLFAGYEKGLYRLDADGAETPLWIEGEVRKIIPMGSGAWLLTAKGPVLTPDFTTFELRAAGLPAKVIKEWDGTSKVLLREPADLKDLELDPSNPERLVTCTKDELWLSPDAGRSWNRIQSPSTTSGLKAVALVPGPVPTVYASHAIEGLFVLELLEDGRIPPKPAWKKARGEFALAPGTGNHDEISDIAVRMTEAGPEVWASNSFLPNLYRLDPATGTFALARSDDRDFAEFDSLWPGPDGLRYLTRGQALRWNPRSGLDEAEPLLQSALRDAARERLGALDCVLARGPDGEPVAFSELWLLAGRPLSAFREAADARHGLYLRTGYVAKASDRERIYGFMEARGLDSLVIDLKDDEGKLRFRPRDPKVAARARVSAPIDVEAITAETRARGIWLVARIVVFKDKALHEASGGALAVWDAKAGAPWRGYELVPGADGAPATRKYYGEHWVDPYSELVWEYNVGIANELIDLGFDEVQFDYIRFPTDGANLGDAAYRFRDPGMDRDSAIASFLRYSREYVHGPVSIDIYGANGWYRSGARTGQDLELLARYVDVVCPMYYPSHFAQDFLASGNAELRPWRIYYLGTLRARAIARDRVVIRPYAQSFFLDVSYDREWYGKRYVELETLGVRDGANAGLTYWNNVARYDEVPDLLLGADRRLALEGPGDELD
ncbi:MAG: hypothetical protein JXA15_00980 [Spirochaetales bacterium]|nr:hypothetical protein [Spirochaetales bacterium]